MITLPSLFEMRLAPVVAALMKYLTSESALPVLKKLGMDPG
jgi:hypothetical protein